MVELGHRWRADELFVGRERELDLARAVVGAVRMDKPQIFVVHGEAGVGKSAFVGQVLRLLNGFVVLRAFCAPEESDLTFGVIGQLLTTRSADDLADSPALRGIHGADVPTVKIGTELLALVGRLQDEGPVALVIEDVQWADVQSGHVLGFVMRRLYADRVLTLITARTSGGVAPWMASTAADTGQGATAVDQLPGWEWLSGHQHEGARLVGLSTSEVLELGKESGVPLSHRAAGRLRDHTGGNPLYLRTLIADARLEPNLETLPVPASLQAALDAHLRELPGDSRTLLEALAVLDRRVALGAAAEVARISEPADALDSLLNAGLVRWLPNDPVSPVEIPHPLQREAVLAAMSPRRLRELHARAATRVPRHAAWAHRVASSESANPELVSELVAEAQRLQSDGYSQRAASFLLWAADLTVRREESQRYVLAAANAMIVGGAVDRFFALVPRVQEIEPCPARDLVLGLHAMMTGRHETAAALLTPVFDAASAPGAEPELAVQAARAGNALAGACLLAGERLEFALEVARKAKALTKSDPELAARTARMPAAIRSVMEPPQAVLDELAPHLPERLSDARPLDSHLLVTRGYTYARLGRLRDSADDLETALRLAPPDHGLQVDVEANYWLALTLYYQGRLDEACMHVQNALSAAMAEQAVWSYTWVASLIAVAEAARGEWDAAERGSQFSEEWHERIGPPRWELFPRTAKAGIAIARGDYTSAAAALEVYSDLTAASEPGYPMLYASLWVPLLVEAWVETGELARAEAGVALLGELAQLMGFLRPAHAWLSGRLAWRAGDPAVAAKRFMDGVAILPGLDDSPFFRARLEESYGLLLSARGQPRTAGELLRSAYRRYSDMNARPYADRVNLEFRSIAIAPPPTAVDVLESLTSRERDIARLVAEGHTNSQVAGQLYLSSKTVEYHLARIFGKLGIKSRRELGFLLPAETGT